MVTGSFYSIDKFIHGCFVWLLCSLSVGFLLVSSFSSLLKPKPAITMTTQTEWDLWGSPISAGRSFISPSKPNATCSCEYNVRLLLEWKREIEKLVESNRDQEKARSNYLRERLASSEEAREKMKGTMSMMSKQIAANATMIAEQSGRGIASNGPDYSSRVFACETGNASPKTSSTTPHHLRDDVRYFPTNKKSTPVPKSTIPTKSSVAQGNIPPPSANGGVSSNVGDSNPHHEALPQRARGKADRSSDTRGSGQTRSGPQTSGLKQSNPGQSVSNAPGRSSNGNDTAHQGA